MCVCVCKFFSQRNLFVKHGHKYGSEQDVYDEGNANKKSFWQKEKKKSTQCNYTRTLKIMDRRSSLL